MGQQTFDGVERHGDPLGVHLVAGDLFAFHRFESTGSDVQCEFVALYAVTVECLQHSFREVQTGCGSCHRSFDFGIDSLVAF